MDPATITTWLLLLAAALFGGAVATISGFGLATVLTPVFALQLEIHQAVLVVAIVHLGNGLFRLTLFRKHIDAVVVRRFGIWCVLGALAGASLYRGLHPSLLQGLLGAVLLALAGRELLPESRRPSFPRRVDQAGGFLAGLVGGAIGNQGAIRSAYLLNYRLPKEVFVGTGTALACAIDLVRVPVYLWVERASLADLIPWAAPALVCAVTGTLLGKRLLKRISKETFRKIVGGLIAVLGVTLIVRAFG